MDWVELVLDPLLADYGREVVYLSPDGMVALPVAGGPPLVGLLLQNGVPLGPDAEDTGGIVQGRTSLRLRQRDFPEGTEPEQGGFVAFLTGPIEEADLAEMERFQVTDILTDPNGWHDLPLAEAPG